MERNSGSWLYPKSMKVHCIKQANSCFPLQTILESSLQTKLGPSVLLTVQRAVTPNVSQIS